MGTVRHNEALAALKAIGVNEKQVTFLGYPDGGLESIFYTTPGQDPYQSTFTETSEVPYSFAYSQGATYERTSVIQDISEIIKSYNPDLVFTSL